jgi:hypothetical protein
VQDQVKDAADAARRTEEQLRHVDAAGGATEGLLRKLASDVAALQDKVNRFMQEGRPGPAAALVDTAARAQRQQ